MPKIELSEQQKHVKRTFQVFRNEFLPRVKIVSKELTEPSAMELYQSQEFFLGKIEEGLMNGVHDFKNLKARQLGISTACLPLDIFWLYTNPGLQGALIADTGDNKETFRETITQMLDGLPKTWRIPIRTHNRNALVLSNSSRLQYMSAGRTKNTGLGRSRAFNFVHATECSSWGDQKGLDSLRAALAREHPNRLYLWESTALGQNLWFDMCQEAKDDAEQSFFFIGWWMKDIYRIKRDTEAYARWWGTFPELTEYEQETGQEVLDKYAHQITTEQWAWYRREADSKSAESMQQEFPSCVSGGTRVGTESGLLRIDQVAPDQIGTLGLITKAGVSGHATLFRLKTRRGYEVCGTADHPMMRVDESFVGLGEAMGAELRLCPPMLAIDRYRHRWSEGVIESSIDITPEIGRFIGMFMGDGSIQAAPHYSFSLCVDTKDQDVVAEVLGLLNTLFGVSGYVREVGANKGGTEVRVGSKLVYETLSRLECLRSDTGPTKRRVHVPEVIWRSERAVVREFLRGLFETDGFVDSAGNAIRFFTKHEQFSKDIQLLLLAFGITCSRDTRLKKTTAPNGKPCEYVGYELFLRKAEVLKFREQIGFIGTRKTARINVSGGTTHFNVKPITMADEVVSVTPEGEADVWNVTVDEHHLFDANGFKTHNTELEAWVTTGSNFFNNRRVAGDVEFARVYSRFRAYNISFGITFSSLKIEEVFNATDADLRVWEEPRKDARYVIGMDVAYGLSETNDRTVIEVFRCFGDKMVQVAEYATSQPETQQAAWVLAWLAGCYRDCRVNLEINGPGMAVMLEIKNLKRQIEQRQIRDVPTGLNIQRNLDSMRWYLWHRPDSMGAGYCYGWKTAWDNKLFMLNQMRDNYNTELLLIRSAPLLAEMQTLKQEGDAISASGRNKDDRVIAAGLACYAWNEWIRNGMMAENRSYKVEMANQEQREKSDRVVDHIIPNFLRERQRDRDARAWAKALGGDL
jgi:hypothetical protein